jgi:hypothetical protein
MAGAEQGALSGRSIADSAAARYERNAQIKSLTISHNRSMQDQYVSRNSSYARDSKVYLAFSQNASNAMMRGLKNEIKSGQ